MNITQKKEIQKLFKEENYHYVIQTCCELSIDDFISLWLKNKWFTNSQLLKELGNSQIFSTIFHSNYSEEILHQYFKGNYVDTFENKLITEFPDIFIKAVRVNQVFLKEKRIDYLSSINFPIKSHQTHQKTWQILHKQDLELWNAIQKELLNISKNSISEVLADIVIWFQKKRDENLERQDISHLVFVYNFFIKLYLQKYSNDTEQLDSVKFKTLLESKIIITKESKLSKILELISAWISFYDGVLSAYCFDLNLDIDADDKQIYLHQSPKSYYKWKIDGLRYNTNRLDYYYKTSKKYKNSFLSDDEEDFLIKRQRIAFLFDDLCFENVVLKGEKIKAKEVFIPLFFYFNSKRVDSPYFFLSKKDFNLDFSKNTPNNFTDKSLENIIDLISYKVNPEYTFDRFNVGYNVDYKPFIQLGGMLFCPSIFPNNNDWFNTVAQMGMTNLHHRGSIRERKRTSTLMENKLGDRLKRKGWSIKVINDNEASNIKKGDVDIIVNDGQSTLFIQLKRTYFRLTPKNAYYEKINTDKKAAKQLNDAEVSLQGKNEVYSLQNPPLKWIVSTSFENVLTKVENCMKVNYFDILHLLENSQIKSISHLEISLKQDKFFKKHINDALPTDTQTVIERSSSYPIHEAQIPVTLLEEPQRHRITLSLNDQYLSKSLVVYQKAFKFYEKNKIDKAIHLWEKYLEMSSCSLDMLDTYGSLANCYASKKNYKQSFFYFKKAISISPDEPYINRNYLGALLEAGNYYECLSLYIELYEKYPYFNLLRIETFDVLLKQHRHAINKKQFEILSQKRNRLS